MIPKTVNPLPPCWALGNQGVAHGGRLDQPVTNSNPQGMMGQVPVILWVVNVSEPSKAVTYFWS